MTNVHDEITRLQKLAADLTAQLPEQPRMTLFLPRDLHDKLRREAFDKRVPMSYIIRDLLEAHYAKGERGATP